MSEHLTPTPDIRVALVDAAIRAAVLQLGVSDEQHDFVGRIIASLPDAEACAGSEPMAILLDGEPIGFYRIETHPRSIADMDFPRVTLGLRSFFIDTRWQGRGLGTRALVAAMHDLARRHPSARDVVLTVNLRNAPALALYRRAGFRETGGLYHGGRSGPQFVMLCALPV
ncbi:MAG TPA: GNAT family N-acetyltransferase [Dyella sp.]|uniref:GNAT family N-acetyltransferase n=1 Tax=Dyella sp. TaxID=1869338 RepID=UPI002D769FA6|nr:GNAT family N-acetyltransferase [Dyella sp.]HET6552455.1 GNAT family N-acetyltransferase [Dyella sp.]